MRSAAAAHPWFAELIGGRPTLGPGALAHLETTLGALGSAAGFKDIDDALQAFDTLNAYVIGAIQSEHSTVRAEAQSGMDPNEWQAASRPYLERLIATGEHPILEKVVREATHPRPEVVFDRGLDCVLDGIQARLVGKAGRRATAQ